MSNTIKAVAPNGATVNVHTPEKGSAFVYTLAHRVYGTLGRPSYYDGVQSTRTFTPEGKYAFILAAPNVEAEAAIAAVDA